MEGEQINTNMEHTAKQEGVEMVSAAEHAHINPEVWPAVAHMVTALEHESEELSIIARAAILNMGRRQEYNLSTAVRAKILKISEITGALREVTGAADVVHNWN